MDITGGERREQGWRILRCRGEYPLGGVVVKRVIVDGVVVVGRQSQGRGTTVLRGDVGVDSRDVTSRRWCAGGNGGGGGEIPCHRRACDARPGNRRREVVVGRFHDEWSPNTMEGS